MKGCIKVSKESKKGKIAGGGNRANNKKKKMDEILHRVMKN